MSDFLKQLNNLSDARNDTTELYEEVEQFAEKYHDAVASTLLNEIKRIIMVKAEKGDFANEDGKRVINGTYQTGFGNVNDKCPPSFIHERNNLNQKFLKKNLPISDLLCFAGDPIFEILGDVTRETTKKGLLFNRVVTEKKTKVRFSLYKGFACIVAKLKEKALEEGIILSDLSYTYMHAVQDVETGKAVGGWQTGLTLTFPDCITPVTFEWDVCASKCKHGVSFGSSITGRLSINYNVEY